MARKGAMSCSPTATPSGSPSATGTMATGRAAHRSITGAGAPTATGIETGGRDSVVVLERIVTSARPARRAHPALRAWSRLPAAGAGTGKPSVEFLRRVRDGRMFRLRGAGVGGADVIATRLRP